LRILYRVVLRPDHERTGRTKHVVSGELMLKTAELRIVKIEPEHGFYLIHYDASGAELTDTLHDTLDEAMQQAEWEFRVAPSDWQRTLD
jgi:hypothetical protein